MSDQNLVEIAHNPDSRDHFEVMGLERKLCIDEKRLAENYYSLSRQYHPDFHHTAPASERLAALRRSAAINDAYNTLRDPYELGKWWLEQQGGRMGQNSTVPPDLVMLVFEVQDELREQAEQDGPMDVVVLGRRRDDIDEITRRRRVELAENFQRWDQIPAGATNADLLDELRLTLASISYLRTLLRDVDATMEKAEE